MYEAPQVSQLAMKIDSPRSKYSPIVQLYRKNQGNSEKERTIICFPPIGGLPLPFAQPQVLSEWGRYGSVTGLQISGYGHGEKPFKHYQEMLSCFEQGIEKAINGKMVFIGWSIGAKIAHDVATYMQNKGIKIDCLVVIDSYATDEYLNKNTNNNVKFDSMNLEDVIDNYIIEIEGDLVYGELKKYNKEQKLVRLTQDLESLGMIPSGVFQISPGFAEKFIRYSLLQANYMIERPIPGYFDGDVLIVRAKATSRLSQTLTLGWERYCKNVETVDINSDHFTLLAGNAAEVTAKTIGKWIKNHIS
ncbi:hypothetical protein E1297_01605 [Roseibium sp. RKSG952]|nr:hypothetical protein [Roseibium sp. RKSG952]